MISAPLSTTRTPRVPSEKAAAAATPPDDASQAQENALTAQRQAFNIELEEQTELEREREALEQMLLARLKDEDEILKKFIALI